MPSTAAKTNVMMEPGVRFPRRLDAFMHLSVASHAGTGLENAQEMLETIFD